MKENTRFLIAKTAPALAAIIPIVLLWVFAFKFASIAPAAANFIYAGAVLLTIPSGVIGLVVLIAAGIFWAGIGWEYAKPSKKN